MSLGFFLIIYIGHLWHLFSFEGYWKGYHIIYSRQILVVVTRLVALDPWYKPRLRLTRLCIHK